jgi:hypothetical protein
MNCNSKWKEMKINWEWHIECTWLTLCQIWLSLLLLGKKKKDWWCLIQFINGSNQNSSCFDIMLLVFFRYVLLKRIYFLFIGRILTHIIITLYFEYRFRRKQCDQHYSSFFFLLLLNYIVIGTCFLNVLQMVDSSLSCAWRNSHYIIASFH